MARSTFRREFPERFGSNQSNRGTSDDSNAPFPERSADRHRQEFSQTLRLLHASGLAFSPGSRPVFRSARRANWKCFCESRRSNQPADEVVSEKLPDRYRRTDVDLASESEAETKMKRAKVFARGAIGIPTIIETDRTDR